MRSDRVPSLPVPVPRSSPPDSAPTRRPDGGARRTSRCPPSSPPLRESVMTDRRLAPLTALTTLTRRPRGSTRRAARGPRAAAAQRARAARGWSTTPSTPTAAGWPRPATAAREPRGAGRGRGPPGLAGPLPARAAGAGRAGRAVRPARARRRGRDQGPPAAEVRAVRRARCSSSSRPPGTWTRPRRSSSGSCTCSSAPTSRSPCGTASRRTSRGCAAGWRASPALLAKGSEAVLYATLDAVVDGYSPVVDGPGQRHRRDRDRGLPRRPGGVPAHLRAVPGGAGVPAGRRSR